MDNDTQAIVVGLGAGLGGFAGFVCFKFDYNEINILYYFS
jgi:hypothetical protein